MKQRIIRLVIILLLLTLVGGGAWYLSSHPQAWSRALVGMGLKPVSTSQTNVTASGFIEARTVSIASEVSGQIAQLAVDEGDEVQAGQELVKINTDLLDAQRAVSEAAVTMAEAQLARVQAGVRAEDIAVAQAAVTLAEAQRDAAYQAWQDALTLRDNPQDLDIQIAAARTQLDISQRRINQLIAIKDAAELINDLRGRQVTVVETPIHVSKVTPLGKFSKTIVLPEGTKRAAWAAWNLATTDVWSAWANLNGAIATRDADRQALNDLLAQRNNPQQAAVQVAQAEAAYRQALVGVDVAQANLELVRAGSRSEQIEVARTGVEQARAALDSLAVQRQKYTLSAPLAGLVTERPAHEGEMALPGKTLLSLANLDTVDLTIYVPEPDVGQVALNQQVAVTVDSFPGQPFTGHVVFISDQAEFTPKNIQTKEERVNTVFAVKVRIPNPDHKLKPGMPADASLVQ
jgi:HlyD family secretion protein